jgi:hypothetical protein
VVGSSKKIDRRNVLAVLAAPNHLKRAASTELEQRHYVDSAIAAMAYATPGEGILRSWAGMQSTSVVHIFTNAFCDRACTTIAQPDKQHLIMDAIALEG